MSNPKRIAAEAERLLNEPLLVAALDELMADAFAEFKSAKIGPETLHEVIALQQRINVLQAIPDQIRAKITAAGERDGGFAVEMTSKSE